MLKKIARTSDTKDSRMALALRCAELYYIKKASQSAIARELGCSVATVSRLLKTAEDEGIVEIRVVNPFARVETLEKGMHCRFGLVDCGVVHAPRTDIERKKVVGATAAELVSGLVADGDLVGLSWGVTMREMVNSLPSYRRPASIRVIPLIGGLGQVMPEHQVNALVHEFAQCFSAEFVMLHAPALSDREETVKLLREELTIAQVVELWGRLNVAVVGIGENPPTSPMRKTGYYTSGEINELVDMGAVGDISGRFFGPNGVEVPASANRRLLAIPFETLRKIPRRVGVAGGPSKVQAILGALRGGLVNVLVTDSDTALALLAD